MSRTFRACEGRTLTLPMSVQPGPGATNMRLHPGAVITLSDETCALNQRFLNGRLRAGDLEELAAPPADAPAAAPVARGTGKHGQALHPELAKEG